MQYRTFPGAGLAVSEIGFAQLNFGVDEPPMNYKGTMEKATA